MSQKTDLFDFLYSLIDTQITKYVRLATIGFGPDARLNAKLVFNEVSELLELADVLLKQIEKGSDLKEHDAEFFSICSQIKFHLEQEKIRADAGLLVAPNNIHEPNQERVTEQLSELQKIIHIDSPPPPQTPIQEQCAYDSHMIAFNILHLAKGIKDNPDGVVDKHTSKPVHDILKQNAKTYYCKEGISQQIDELHQTYDLFIKNSPLEASHSKLDFHEARQVEIQHRAICQQLSERYQRVNPDSVLFLHQKNLNVAVATTPTRSSLANWGLFGTAVGLTATIGLSVLVNYVFNNYIEPTDECPWTP